MVENFFSIPISGRNKIFTSFIWRKFFPRFFALYYQKSMEFLSSLVFHTVTIHVIQHYYKLSLVQ